jgi:hypothetical protein
VRRGFVDGARADGSFFLFPLRSRGGVARSDGVVWFAWRSAGVAWFAERGAGVVRFKT